MYPNTVPTPKSTLALLPDADFSDAFAIDVVGENLTARQAAAAVFQRVPGWISRLLALRDTVVRPFGLKGTDAAAASGRDRIGFFPIVAEADDRIILGFDDTHLDFRIVVDVERIGTGAHRVTATTLVRRHNLFGRVYLASIMPFHKLIVPTMLRQIARAA